jgi:hypothetical protein
MYLSRCGRSLVSHSLVLLEFVCFEFFFCELYSPFQIFGHSKSLECHVAWFLVSALSHTAGST